MLKHDRLFASTWTWSPTATSYSITCWLHPSHAFDDLSFFFSHFATCHISKWRRCCRRISLCCLLCSIVRKEEMLNNLLLRVPSFTPTVGHTKLILINNKVDLIHSLLTHFCGPGSQIWLTLLMECAHNCLQPPSPPTVSLSFGCWRLMLYGCEEVSIVLPFVLFDTLFPISLKEKKKAFLMSYH